MKHRHPFSGSRIWHLDASGFPQRARNTGERQIRQLCQTAETDRKDVIHMKNGLLTFLREAAVFTAVARPLHYLPSQ